MENFNNYIVNISNLKHNFNIIKQHLNPNVKVCAMVKADAYGHGIKDVCKGLKEADFFGVASVYEASQIRKFDKDKSILIVGVFNHEYALWCSQNNVSVAVTSLAELKELIDILDGSVLKIHIKINSGLNRIGVDSLSQFKSMLKLIKHHSNIVLEGLFTHFATKSNDVQFIIKQHGQFLKYVALIDETKVIVHCCNSYATLLFPCFQHGMVRCGYNLYGWQNEFNLDFKPVLNITSKLVFLHKIKKGESVGYDRTFVAKKDSVIGVVPIGYADGFDRRLSNQFKVLVNGKFVNVVGNICMDVFMVDVTNINVNVGDDVVLIGDSFGMRITPQDYATCLGTSPYEILLKFDYRRFNRIILK